MLALSLPNGFAGQSYRLERLGITRSTATLGCVSLIHRHPLLSANRPVFLASSLDCLGSSFDSSHKSFVLRTYEKSSCNHSRINTSGTKDLKSPGMNTYRKTGGGMSAVSPARSARAAKNVAARAVKKSGDYGYVPVRSEVHGSGGHAECRVCSLGFSYSPQDAISCLQCIWALWPSLFCAVQDVNPSAFKHLCALGALFGEKHPGWG